ncbi:hypothetical protein J8273_4491 [Carpediemonas membranifera]|uniref:Uncharacterized protein n=1 Tax=Carpediemonas membranifera TaxID=201153 RepID=A0A8J6ATR0_9EUKA|nr:hypothetical protein J8273_4491 [Carpediemonas membranifera]|eukprot:KAG9393898.1 hypothetical protein J8273_4491 [Carpediemonas membranifera]
MARSNPKARVPKRPNAQRRKLGARNQKQLNLSKKQRKITMAALDLVQSFINSLEDPGEIERANKIVTEANNLGRDQDVRDLNPTSARDNNDYRHATVRDIEAAYTGDGDNGTLKRFAALVSLDGDDEDELRPDDPLMACVKSHRDLFLKIPAGLREEVHQFVSSQLDIPTETIRHILHANTQSSDATEIFKRPTLVPKRSYSSVEELGDIIVAQNRKRVEAERRDAIRRKIYETIMMFYMIQSTKQTPETD